MIAIPVFVALAGTHGINTISVMPSPDASGAVHCVKLSVPVIVPVTVALPVAAAVALARIDMPQIYVVLPDVPASVAVVAPVVPVADAVIGVAPDGYCDDWMDTHGVDAVAGATQSGFVALGAAPRICVRLTFCVPLGVNEPVTGSGVPAATLTQLAGVP